MLPKFFRFFGHMEPFQREIMCQKIIILVPVNTRKARGKNFLIANGKRDYILVLRLIMLD